jgi:hypothetical protein
MNAHPEPQSTHLAATPPSPPGQASSHRAASSRWTKRWLKLAALCVALGTVGLIGREASRRIETHDIEISSRRQEPLPGFPKNLRADINSIVIRMGWVGNLYGTAVAYAAEADNLVTPDGRIRSDLTVDEASRLLHLNPVEIAKKGQPLEIDEGAPLFRAQTGQLTPESRERARKRRLEQLANGLHPDAATGEWEVREFVFTLRSLKHPTDEEQTILSAIIQSALCRIPKPGDTIRAIPVNRGDIEPGRVALSAGMLPPEEPMTRGQTVPTQRHSNDIRQN